MAEQIILLLTGVFLFLFGLIKLSIEMQRILGVRIRQYIKRLVKKPVQGVILGGVFTAIFQASSATTVLTVGMVSAGLISFFSSLGIILGADIGTTITAQLVALKFTDISPIFIIAGIALWMVGKDKLKSAGEAIFYFGLLFFGLSLVGQAIVPFKQSPTFIRLIQETKNPLIGTLVGLIFTVIIQSSSATTSVLVLLGQKGLITIESAFPIVLGANIGTTVTALLASIGANINGKRSALAHLFFKFIAVLLVFPFLGVFISFLKNLTPNIAQQIANGHLLFNLGLICFFIFLLKPFARLIKKILPGEQKVLPLWTEYLDGRLLANPELALEAVREEIKRGARLVQKMFSNAIKIIFDYKASIFRDITYLELVIDGLQKDVMKFIDRIPKEKLNRDQAKKLIQYSTMIDTVERLADQVTNLSKLAGHKKRLGVEFSAAGKKEIKEIKKILDKSLEDAVFLIGKKDREKIAAVMRREDKVDKKVDEAREKHLERFYRREVSVADGPIFNDIMINFERISDHCVNITEHYLVPGTRN